MIIENPLRNQDQALNNGYNLDNSQSGLDT